MPTGTDLPAVLNRVIDRYLAYLRIERGLAANTISAYRRDLTRYVHYLVAACPDHAPDALLASVDPHTVSEYIAVLRTGEDGGKPLGAASAGRALAAMRGLHRFLADEDAPSFAVRAAPPRSHLVGPGAATDDPTRDITPPRRPDRLPKALGVDEVLRLMETAHGDAPGLLGPERGVRDAALLELLYGTGARISEAVGLDVDDIDCERAEVLLTGKGNKQRIVPVGRYALEAVSAYLVRGRPALARRGTGSSALFLGIRGTRLTRQAAWAVVREIAERTGIAESFGPHTLRHSYATHLVQGGADVRTVQELLGHASLTTTQMYTRVTVDSLRESWALAHPRAR
ncbi:site-specific tyrosine recombinase XerD [Devriesea agamarum]|uniref:site-specific tyrosine recombinase XerD n=1 Tax=Devriesea agamarum TaxID=472569 RepID=UPI00071C3DFC|nr:site-specific tyrosine recombinase XerD [Devriesea agamarum]